MRKSIFALFFVFALVSAVLSSCKKDTAAEGPDKEEFKGKLKTVSGDSYLTTYHYNKEGLAQNKLYTVDGNELTKFSYAYLNGKFNKVEVYTIQNYSIPLSLAFSRQYHYTGNNFTEMIGTPVSTGPNAPHVANGRYTYDASGRLLTYEYWDPNEDPMYVYEYQVNHLTFDNNGNIITVVTKTYDKDRNLLSTGETKYEYDDKPNPYYQLGEPEDVLVYFSRNNCVKMTMSTSTGDYVEQYNYEYNAEGKPVKKYKTTIYNVNKLVNEFTYY
ncbi:hypothetical protein [Pedobacter foliorum]|uniref:hypothetical protein n=1 Tax=Pedobacter foliorum TaxID=2739058 RepID=UPI0015666D76|nr:hypothetical protein [Pedobacter foliorum]NRF37412.1 hypothetical protein [Pedobacter foliorum]